jgi:DNA mismatch repair ATPase MutS
MDEVGRGTTTSTALAIAFATMHHLYTVNKCRGLFATHFHEIADMLGFDESTGKATGLFKNIAFFCTDIDEISVSAHHLVTFSLVSTVLGYGADRF